MGARIAVFSLAASLLAACGEPPMRVQIPFAAVFSGARVDCAGTDDVQLDDLQLDNVQLTDLRFYVYDVHLMDAAGNVQALNLDDDGPWQQANLALLDLENGNGGCTNGTSDTYRTLTGTVIDGDYRGLSFTLGVPFDNNHRDPLLAKAPLDDAAMHWHWRGGYKFLRAGIRDANDGFWMHLGSTGCQGTLQNITGCNAPNRVTVELDNFVPGRDLVVIDLGELVTRGELDDGTATDCSSGPAETHCAAAFLALGLDHSSGASLGVQRVFSSRPMP